MLRDRLPRRLSPALFLLAALSFLLPFAAVSCDSSAVSSALPNPPPRIGHDRLPVGSCVTALNQFSVITYSGIDLALGLQPSTAQQADLPSECQGIASESSVAVNDLDPFTDPAKATIGLQPFLLAALILIVVGLVAGALRLRRRGFLAALVAVLAGICVIVGENAVAGPINSVISGGLTGLKLGVLPPGTDASKFSTVTRGLGMVVCLAILVVAALMNGVEGLLSLRGGQGSGDAPAELAGGLSAPPVPSGSGPGPV